MREGKKHTAQDPQATHERERETGRQRGGLPTKNEGSLTRQQPGFRCGLLKIYNSPTFSQGQQLRAWRIEFLATVLEKELMGIQLNGMVLGVKAAKYRLPQGKRTEKKRGKRAESKREKSGVGGKASCPKTGSMEEWIPELCWSSPLQPYCPQHQSTQKVSWKSYKAESHSSVTVLVWALKEELAHIMSLQGCAQKFRYF